MISATTLIIVILFYIGVLYFLATWAESGNERAQKISSSVIVYIFSIAIYCTSWTFFGSVGLASRSGILMFTIYLGPTLLMLVIWPLMQRILLIKQVYHVNSIADFLSARFNRSLYLAGLVSVVAMIGIVPYLALQLKAINSSINLILSTDGGSHLSVTWLVWIGVALFTIIFGIRHLDPTERHPGMMLALAVEGAVKLIAMLVVGVFVCFFMFDGPFDIFSQLQQQLPEAAEKMASRPNLMTWISFLLLAGSAFIMLPRQFHVMVVENSEPNYIKKVQWALPIYLLLMTMFVTPIAAAGLLAIGPQYADRYMLALPLLAEQSELALLVFIGGFSASMAMLMVSGMTLSTMFSNHLALPLLQWLAPESRLSHYLLQVRWLGVFLVLGAGQAFYLFLGESYMLANMGMISFCAVLQFLPLVLMGVYWRHVNTTGAIAGISAGFFVWAYCLFIPAIMKSGWIDADILQHGPWGISWLHPEHLFGTEMDKVSHGAFWSLIANVSTAIIASLFCQTSKEEDRYNAEFIDVMTQRQGEEDVKQLNLPSDINLQQKVDILTRLFNQYLPDNDTKQKLDTCLEERKVQNKTTINVQELADIEKTAERMLSGITGAAMAHILIKKSGLFTELENKALENCYNQMLSQLKISPIQLRQQLNYAQEKEQLAMRYSEQLQTLVDNRTQELQDAMHQLKEAQSQLVETEKQASLGKLVAGIAHEINTPIGVCVTAASNLHEESNLLQELYDEGKLSESQLLEFIDLCGESSDIILKNNERASKLIQSFKQVAVDQSSDELRQFQFKEYIDEILLSLRPKLKRVPHVINIECEPHISCTSYPGAISQILTNLIMNSLLHAFEPEQKGQININVTQEGNTTCLHFQDDGIGLDVEGEKNLFDPFYTTKRNEGGSGLGAHLVYNLVNRKLGGEVQITTAPGAGLSYFIHFPSQHTG